MTRIVVVGDALLDRDVIGSIERMCPDAPVPVVDEIDVRSRPGGAALAALLAARGGMEVTLVTALADDAPAGELRALLAGAGVEVVPLAATGSTPEKSRVRVGEHSVLRIDRGGLTGVDGDGADLAGAFRSADAVLVSDYGRGVAADRAVRAALSALPARRRTMVWDPHPRGPRPVPHVALACPNARETLGAAGMTAVPGETQLGRIHAAATALHATWETVTIAVTMGDQGAMFVSGPGSPLLVPPARRVVGGDACGAGDAFAARATLALAQGALPSEAVQSAVHAATAFVAEGGAGSMTSTHPTRCAIDDGSAAPPAGAGSTGTVVAAGGCFDVLHPGHVGMLQQARRLGDRLIVLLNSDASVRRLKGPSRPVQTDVDRATVLRALDCVDEVIVFDEDTPVDALRRLQPQVFVKGGDYAAAAIPEAEVMGTWGGCVVTVPYTSGRSTTEILGRAAREVRDVV